MRYSKWLLVLLIPLILGLYSFRVYLYNDAFYQEEFEKTGVYEEFGEEYVNSYKTNLFSYFQNSGELNEDYFNEKERMHLEDVKNLIKYFDYFYYFISGLFLIIFFYLAFNKKCTFWDVFLYGGILSISLYSLIAIICFFSFNFAFTLFHKILFDNMLWLMDPAKDKIILIFTKTFFYDFFIRMFLFIFLFSLCLIFIGGYKIKFKNTKDL